MKPGDKVYLISDGYPDQFGGEKGKKFMYKPLKRMLLDNSGESFSDQGVNLNETFEKWKGQLEQTDDVCIIGFEI